MYDKSETDIFEFNAKKRIFKIKNDNTNYYQELLNLHKSNILSETLDRINKFVESEFKKKEKLLITANQLRNIYDEVIKISDTDINGIQFLRPKLAYIAGRNKGAKEIVVFLDKLVSDIETEDNVKSFKTFMEAVVSYHKFYHD